MKGAGAATLSAFVVALAASAATQEAREIRFAPGESSATVSGAVVRGTRDLYGFSARAGQVAGIEVSALESNAAMTVWRPGARLGQPNEDIQGRALPGAGEGEDARRWTGTLPETGRYLIVVGPTRGNATYRLRLNIAGQPSQRTESGSAHPSR